VRANRKVCSVVLCLLFAYVSFAQDWPKYRGNLSNSGSGGGSNITLSNVTSLKLKWSFNIGADVTASPAVATINGTSLAFVGGWNGWFYAANAVTGQEIWKFEVDLVGPCSVNNCRIASSPDVTNGIVYFGAENAYLYALNAASGALVWKQQLANPNNGYEIWSSPAVYNNVVYVGLASHGDSPCVVGQVVARNASTGATVWSFSTIDETSCPGGSNCVGAGVWASPALDTTNGILYVGTGNPGSTCSPSTPNATRYPDSILALKMSNGQLLNHYQAIANDNSDDDFGSSPVLWTTEFDNCHSNLFYYWVAEASKNGSLYLVPRGASGLSGTASSTSLDPNGFIASPAFLLYSHSASGCGSAFSFGYLYVASGNVSGGEGLRNRPGQRVQQSYERGLDDVSVRSNPDLLGSNFGVWGSTEFRTVPRGVCRQ
jgi:outer membrane protein assembly factor BamB